jgi:hypothetical protein
MPRVPTAENVVPFARTTDAKIQTPDMTEGARRIAQGLGNVAESLGGASHDFEVVAAAQDNAATKEAANQVDAQANDVLFTGQDPYFDKRGKDALSARPDTEKQLDSFIAEARKNLKTPRQREMFDERVKQQRLSWGTRIADHAHTQAFKYDDDQTEASIVLSGQSASANFLDPEQSRKDLDTGIANIRHRSLLNGWSPDQTKVEELKFTSGVHQDIGSRLAYEGGAEGPKLADAYADRHRSELTNDGYEAIKTHSRVQQNSLDAEQRRIEADARREAREARSDAKDRANSVYRNIQDGVAVDPKTLASAIGDAKTAEDDALAEGLRQGGLKNSLTQQYANATPGELQNRVNELSSEITKAGGKVDPDKIVERDHLQTLVSKSRSALNNDPLAWGAEHLGLSVPKLNLNDQGSVDQRLSVAATIARRTGTIPKPLTQDEVAATQQTLNHGTTQEKVALAMRLSRLGNMALPAAEQLTSNPAYLNIIGLATHSNRGVAASRVNQVITGYDVLKTKPKLVNKDDAQRQFNEFTGSALQFLPQAKTGVLSNAQALLASEANEHGWSEWGDADSRAWYRAVNSALGAYTRDGKQVGGLARVNGAVTVLPENMTQEEFEGRISKAHGPEFRNAQNGVPVYADGRNPTATDLKRMQWIPSGDGVYRLTDGHGFLHTKEGGFYEVDANRLHPREGGAPRPFGMISPGNIDIHHRPVVHNKDGSISTVRSFSIGTERGEVLIPQVVNGKVVTKKEAEAHYRQTGEHLGIFKSPAAATAFAKKLHEQQAQEYDPDFNAQLAAHGYSRH